MSGRGYCRGHKVYYDNEKEEWLYSDDNTSAMIERPCERCKMEATKEGHDYCLKGLSDCNIIKSACCGHGVKTGYIILSDGRRFVLESEKHPTDEWICYTLNKFNDKLDELYEERDYFERKKCEYWNKFNLAHLDNINLRKENEQLKQQIKDLRIGVLDSIHEADEIQCTCSPCVVEECVKRVVE